MSTLHLVAAQPWVERLGWTLVHFLWQGVLISALYAVARQWMARSSSPNTRYLLACGALAAMMIVPFVTLSWIQPLQPGLGVHWIHGPCSIHGFRLHHRRDRLRPRHRFRRSTRILVAVGRYDLDRWFHNTLGTFAWWMGNRRTDAILANWGGAAG